MKLLRIEIDRKILYLVVHEYLKVSMIQYKIRWESLLKFLSITTVNDRWSRFETENSVISQKKKILMRPTFCIYFHRKKKLDLC